MSILEGGKVESCLLNDSHHKHFQFNLNSILSVLACKFNLISRDIILPSYCREVTLALVILFGHQS